MSPAAAVALLEEGDAAHARCKKLLPPYWAGVLKEGREMYRAVMPIIELHTRRSPGAWRLELRGEAHDLAERRAERACAKIDQGPFRCDGCRQRVPELKWCACRLKRYCSRECQKRDFPAHKAACKAARGVA